MSFNNCWTISSSYDFHVHQQHSQRRCCFSRTALLWFEVLPDMSPALPCALRLVIGAPSCVACVPRYSQTCHWCSQICWWGSQVLPGSPKGHSSSPRCFQTYHNHSYGTPVAVVRDPSYSEGRQECPRRVWFSPEIDASKITLHILPDTPGFFQLLQYILRMTGRPW